MRGWACPEPMTDRSLLAHEAFVPLRRVAGGGGSRKTTAGAGAAPCLLRPGRGGAVGEARGGGCRLSALGARGAVATPVGTPRWRCPWRLSPPLLFPCSGEIAETPVNGDTHPAAASSFFSSSSSSPRRKSQIKGRGATGCAARRGGRRRRRPPDAAAIRHCRARLGAGRREARYSCEGPGGRGAAAPPARPLPRAAATAFPDARPPPAGSPGWTGSPLLPALALCAAKGKCGEWESCAPRGRGAAFVCSAAPRRRRLSAGFGCPRFVLPLRGGRRRGRCAPHPEVPGRRRSPILRRARSYAAQWERRAGSPALSFSTAGRHLPPRPPRPARLLPASPGAAANKGGRGGAACRFAVAEFDIASRSVRSLSSRRMNLSKFSVTPRAWLGVTFFLSLCI